MYILTYLMIHLYVVAKADFGCDGENGVGINAQDVDKIDVVELRLCKQKI